MFHGEFGPLQILPSRRPRDSGSIVDSAHDKRSVPSYPSQGRLSHRVKEMQSHEVETWHFGNHPSVMQGPAIFPENRQIDP